MKELEKFFQLTGISKDSGGEYFFGEGEEGNVVIFVAFDAQNMKINCSYNPLPPYKESYKEGDNKNDDCVKFSFSLIKDQNEDFALKEDGNSDLLKILNNDLEIAGKNPERNVEKSAFFNDSRVGAVKDASCDEPNISVSPSTSYLAGQDKVFIATNDSGCVLLDFSKKQAADNFFANFGEKDNVRQDQGVITIKALQNGQDHQFGASNFMAPNDGGLKVSLVNFNGIEEVSNFINLLGLDLSKDVVVDQRRQTGFYFKNLNLLSDNKIEKQLEYNQGLSL